VSLLHVGDRLAVIRQPNFPFVEIAGPYPGKGIVEQKLAAQIAGRDDFRMRCQE
jgi:hypothetical protein